MEFPKNAHFMYLGKYMILPTYKKLGTKTLTIKGMWMLQSSPEHKKINARFTQGLG